MLPLGLFAVDSGISVCEVWGRCLLTFGVGSCYLSGSLLVTIGCVSVSFGVTVCELWG